MKTIIRLLLVGLLCVNFVIMGCAGFGKFSPGAQSVVDLICAPSAEQQATAAAMLAALDLAQTSGAIFFPVIGIVKASAVLTTIKHGGCFLVAELAEAFKAVDAANTAKMQAKGPRFAAEAKLPEYPALRKLVK